MPPSRRPPPRSRARLEGDETPWWQHWYVGVAAVPLVIGFLVLAVMAIQRISVGSSNFYVATLAQVQGMPIVVNYAGNGIEVESVQHAEVPLFGGDTLLVLVVKGSRGEVRLVAKGHADSYDHAEYTRLTLETLRGEHVDLLKRHVNGL